MGVHSPSHSRHPDSSASLLSESKGNEVTHLYSGDPISGPSLISSVQFEISVYKASSANLILINEALAKARSLREGLMRMEGGPAEPPSSATQTEAPPMNQHDEAPAPASAPASCVASSSLKPPGSRLPPGMGMWSLSRGIYLHNRAEHRLPSLKWFYFNGIVQVRVPKVLNRSMGSNYSQAREN